MLFPVSNSRLICQEGNILSIRSRFLRFSRIKTSCVLPQNIRGKEHRVYVNCYKITKHDSRDLIIAQYQVVTLDT